MIADLLCVRRTNVDALSIVYVSGLHVGLPRNRKRCHLGRR